MSKIAFAAEAPMWGAYSAPQTLNWILRKAKGQGKGKEMG